MLIGCLIVVGVALAMLHAHYPLDYVARVLIQQESDFDDFEWKPSKTIAAPAAARPLPRAVDAERVRTAFQVHPSIDHLDSFMADIGSTALVVLKGGDLMYEAYYNGSNESALQAGFSVSKSLLSIMMGGAIARGDLGGLETPITDYLPELAARDGDFAKITLGHLLDMRSGIGFQSSVSFPWINQDPSLVYYTNDMRKTVLIHPRIAGAPGTFLYNDYNPNLIGLALERATGSDLVELFSQTVWQPLGAEYDSLWSTDYGGFPMTESGFVARARDLARVGRMMLDGGRVGDQELIPPEWHHRSTHRLEPFQFEEYNGRQWGYRTGWWIVSRPADPPDYAAIGHFGQLIYVSPQNAMVVVRTGEDSIGVNDLDLTEIFYATADRL